MDFSHQSVLLHECIQGLQIKSSGKYVDATLGGGGHALEVCNLLGNNGALVGIDQDKYALARAAEVLAPVKDRVTLVHDNFRNINDIFKRLNITSADGFLLDLGVSSFQLDDGDRGFSYQHDAPLDMRMDKQGEGLCAYDVLNTYTQQRLHEIIATYGEERWAKRIAEFVVKQRHQQPIRTTGELVEVIKKAVPKAARADGPHPAKRTFQAIRIEVNDELGILQQSIRDMAALLSTGGRLCVITFHSLEDRLVKQTFRELANPCTCPRELPFCHCQKKPSLVVKHKPIYPSDQEIQENRRARSAKLRISEKV